MRLHLPSSSVTYGTTAFPNYSEFPLFKADKMTEHDKTTVIIDELRESLARHDAWPTREAAAVVIIHARRLIRAIDQPPKEQP